MTNQIQDATIFASSYPDIVSKTSMSKLTGSFCILVAGILVFFSILEIQDRSSIIGMGIMLLGSALCLTGIFRLLWKSRVSTYKETGSVLREKSIYFDLKYMNQLTDSINKKDFSALDGIKSAMSSNLRMDLLISADKKFAAVQLFQFIPYRYTPITDVYYYKDEFAKEFINFVNRSNG